MIFTWYPHKIRCPTDIRRIRADRTWVKSAPIRSDRRPNLLEWGWWGGRGLVSISPASYGDERVDYILIWVLKTKHKQWSLGFGLSMRASKHRLKFYENWERRRIHNYPTGLSTIATSQSIELKLIARLAVEMDVVSVGKSHGLGLIWNTGRASVAPYAPGIFREINRFHIYNLAPPS